MVFERKWDIFERIDNVVDLGHTKKHFPRDPNRGGCYPWKMLFLGSPLSKLWKRIEKNGRKKKKEGKLKLKGK